MGKDVTSAGMRDLESGLRELEIDASPVQVGALLDLAHLLADWSTRISLTGHRGVEGILHGLILESLALAKALPPWRTLVDLGSGAGFPGLPIAAIWPEREVILVESREKRVHFQRAAIRKIELDNATPLHGRAENLDPQPADVAVAMAMAKPELAIEFMQSWVGSEGYLVLPLGSERPEIEVPAGFEFRGVTSYSIPLSGLSRALWLARRLKS